MTPYPYAAALRSAISLVVLMVEGTRGVDYLFGVILAVVVANWVAHHIHHDGTHTVLERDCYHHCCRSFCVILRRHFAVTECHDQLGSQGA